MLKWKIEEVVKWNIEQRNLDGIRGISEDADQEMRIVQDRLHLGPCERSIFRGHVTLQEMCYQSTVLERGFSSLYQHGSI